MSRIYDALKKVEQERVASSDVQLDPGQESEAPVLRPKSTPIVGNPAAEAAHVNSAPMLNNRLTLDALLAQCAELKSESDAQTMWHKLVEVPTEDSEHNS